MKTPNIKWAQGLTRINEMRTLPFNAPTNTVATQNGQSPTQSMVTNVSTATNIPTQATTEIKKIVFELILLM
jgi:hypothetical protein